MKKSGPLIVLLGLLAVLFVANNFLHKSGMTTKEAQKAVAEEAEKIEKEQRSKIPVDKTAAALNHLPEEVSYNVSTRNEHLITIGWYFDVKNQSNQLPLIDIIEAAKRVSDKSRGTVGVEAVNLEVPASEVSAKAVSVAGLGVALDGDCVTDAQGIVYEDNPGQANDFAFQKIEDALMLALHIPAESEGKVFGSDIQPRSSKP
jgi:hypothetical protein